MATFGGLVEEEGEARRGEGNKLKLLFLRSILTGQCIGQFIPWWACYYDPYMGAALYLQPCNGVCTLYSSLPSALLFSLVNLFSHLSLVKDKCKIGL
jgi:hypothetical protein